LRLFKKTGNTIQILSFPGEDIEKGGYLIIDDEKSKKSMIVQVIDIQFANIPGIMGELLREPDVDEVAQGGNIDPLNIMSHILYIQDARLLLCKIHGTIKEGKLNLERSWLPSRTHSRIRKLSTDLLIKLVRVPKMLPINLGTTQESTQLVIDACELDGKLNIITGKKGTGKSHLSKLLVLGLVEYGATLIILDLNGEYTNLGLSPNGEKNNNYSRIFTLKPGKNFKVTLYRTDLFVIMKILTHALDLPGSSRREFRNIWRFLKRQNTVSLYYLGETIKNWKCNQHVKDAIFSRYTTLIHSNFFTDNTAEETDFENLLNSKNNKKGKAVIINLSDTSVTDRQIIVEYVLSKIQQLLALLKVKAMFLFAEEAHLYLRETYWDDIITRMRHYGFFATFITNQPNTIRENIYRQADNIFLFNFVNENDLESVSKAARVDGETVISIVRDLPPHHCLVLGNVVKDFPIVTKVRHLNIKTMGHTRFFFNKNEVEIN
jgi:hypothetical protein